MNHSIINNTYTKIRKLVIEGKTKLALEELEFFIESYGDDSLEDEFMLLSARYHRCDKKRRQGLSSSDMQHEFNRIDSNLIEILREVKVLALESFDNFDSGLDTSDKISEYESQSLIKDKEFEALVYLENEGNAQRYCLKKGGRELEYREVLQLWEQDDDFLNFFISLFKKCGFNSYIWEMPPVSTNTSTRSFEFVILNTPMPSKLPDYTTYSEYFDTDNANYGIVVFPNLGHDATLVVPSPFRDKANYSGLASFFQEAPINQQKALWKVTAIQIKMRISSKPIWISVAGGGISWLHVRLDDKPKYYRYWNYTKYEG